VDLSPETINWSRFSHRLWRAWEVDVRINISLYIILLAVVWIPFSGWGHFPRTLVLREAADLGLLFVAMTAAILFHELGHALIAKILGNKVRVVLIHAFGGVTILEENEARDVWQAVLIFASGPIASALYGLTCLLSGFGDIADFSFTIALLNIVPILPLDGGQILWHLLGSNQMLSKYRIMITRWVGRITFGILIACYLNWFSVSILVLFWGGFEYIMFALAKD
jgi:Zn-dependent protease